MRGRSGSRRATSTSLSTVPLLREPHVDAGLLVPRGPLLDGGVSGRFRPVGCCEGDPRQGATSSGSIVGRFLT